MRLIIKLFILHFSMVVLLFFSGSSAGQLGNDREIQKDDVLYFLDLSKPGKEISSVIQSRYIEPDLNPASLMIATCRICEVKYSHSSKVYRSIRKDIQRRFSKQQEEITRVKDLIAFRERNRKVKGHDFNGQITEYDSKKLLNILETNYSDQGNWVKEIHSLVSKEIRETLLKEQMRFIVLRLGVANALDFPVFREMAKLSEADLERLRKKHHQAYLQGKEIFETEIKNGLRKIFSSFSNSQLRKVERRVGVTAPNFWSVFDYSNVYEAGNAFRGNNPYLVSVKQRKIHYVGIEGLKKFSKKFESLNLVRYHVSEVNPVNREVSPMVRKRSYRLPVISFLPFNALDQNSLDPETAASTSSIWSFEVLDSQLEPARSGIQEWKRSIKISDSIESQIEANNQLLKNLKAVTIPRQNVRLFRGFFKAHGPVAFFFLLGNKQNYQLSSAQLKRLESNGKAAADNIINRVQESWKTAELRVLKESLSKSQLERVEQIVGLPLEQIVSDSVEFRGLSKSSPRYDVIRHELGRFTLKGANEFFRFRMNQNGHHRQLSEISDR